MGLLFNNNAKKIKIIRAFVLSSSETLKFIVDNKYNASDITNICVKESEKKITHSFILKELIEAKISFYYADNMSRIFVTANLDAATEDIANCLIYLHDSDNKIKAKGIISKSINELKNSKKTQVNTTLPNNRYISFKVTNGNIIEAKIQHKH